MRKVELHFAHQFVCGNDRAAREGGKNGSNEGGIDCLLIVFDDPLVDEELSLEIWLPFKDNDEEVESKESEW